MSNICFLFPGQGSQKVGMGADFVKICCEAKNVFETASNILGFNLLDICLNKNQVELNKTIYCQPAIVATSIAAFLCLKQKGITPDVVTGHSLGQYSALFAAGVLSLQDTFKIIKIRAEIMMQNSELNEGRMCAIIGAKKEDIEKACNNAKEYVTCANFNSPTQTVISGTINGVHEVISKLKNIAKRCVMLNVKCAFHSKLMQNCANLFEEKIKNINFKTPKIKIFSNITANIITEKYDIRNMLIKHITAPVLFMQSILNMEKFNIKTFIELGEGKVLTQLVKKTINNATTLNINNEDSLINTTNFLNKNI